MIIKWIDTLFFLNITKLYVDIADWSLIPEIHVGYKTMTQRYMRSL